MASNPQVARILAILQEVWPREITTELVRIYADTLRDLDDDALMRAARQHLRTARFFPTPAELRDAAGVNRAPFVDTEHLLDCIAMLSSYHPRSGTTPPRVEQVRGAFGDATAEAYGIAGGGDRLYSGNETTRAIARREFAQELRELIRQRGPSAFPAANPELPALPDGPVIYDAPRAARGPRLLSAALPEVRP